MATSSCRYSRRMRPRRSTSANTITRNATTKSSQSGSSSSVRGTCMASESTAVPFHTPWRKTAPK